MLSCSHCLKASLSGRSICPSSMKISMKGNTWLSSTLACSSQKRRGECLHPRTIVAAAVPCCSHVADSGLKTVNSGQGSKRRLQQVASCSLCTFIHLDLSHNYMQATAISSVITTALFKLHRTKLGQRLTCRHQL